MGYFLMESFIFVRDDYFAPQLWRGQNIFAPVAELLASLVASPVATAEGFVSGNTNATFKIYMEWYKKSP